MGGGGGREYCNLICTYQKKKRSFQIAGHNHLSKPMCIHHTIDLLWLASDLAKVTAMEIKYKTLATII